MVQEVYHQSLAKFLCQTLNRHSLSLSKNAHGSGEYKINMVVFVCMHVCLSVSNTFTVEVHVIKPYQCPPYLHNYVLPTKGFSIELPWQHTTIKSYPAERLVR